MARNRVSVAAAVTLLVTALVWGIAGSGAFVGFRVQATDALFPSERSGADVVVVGVDARSIDEVGRWPWSRSTQAQLVANLAAAGASAIALDVVYSPATAEDEALAAALREAPAVVAIAGDFGTDRGGRMLTSAEPVMPVEPIASAASLGHAAVRPSPVDGVTRSVPLVLETASDAFLPSLALAAVARLERADTGALTVRANGVQFGDRAVPTTGRAELLINWTEESRTIPAVDVLRGQSRDLRGAVVFVGVTDPTLGDRHLIPTSKSRGAAGVEVHAQAAATMLSRSYLRLATTTETVAWSFFLAGMAALALSFLRMWLAGIFTVSAAALYTFFVFARFDAGVVMDLVLPLGALVGSYVVLLAVRLVIETRQRRRMVAVLTQYVPTPVARQLLARGPGSLPTGTITFLFTDVVDSTAAWERWPRQMGEAMRRHDELIEQAVERSGGAVVRPRGEGDSRFVVFVRPADALAAAASIDRCFTSERWRIPQPVSVRIGIHTGDAELRAGDYYGSPVNRCARIRSAAGPGQVFVSAATAALVGDDIPEDAQLEDRGKIALKGVEEPEQVYELVLPTRRRRARPRRAGREGASS